MAPAPLLMLRFCQFVVSRWCVLYECPESVIVMPGHERYAEDLCRHIHSQATEALFALSCEEKCVPAETRKPATPVGRRAIVVASASLISRPLSLPVCLFGQRQKDAINR